MVQSNYWNAEVHNWFMDIKEKSQTFAVLHLNATHKTKKRKTGYLNV